MDHGTPFENSSAVNSAAIKAIVISAIFLVLAFVSVGLRIWARKLKNCAWSWNDHAIVIALVCVYSSTLLRIDKWIY